MAFLKRSLQKEQEEQQQQDEERYEISSWYKTLKRLEPDTVVFKRKLKSYLFRSVFTQ